LIIGAVMGADSRSAAKTANTQSFSCHARNAATKPEPMTNACKARMRQKRAGVSRQ